jgi:hypothetical protein
LKNVPNFIDAADEVYLAWSAPLSKTGSASSPEISTEFSRLLDQDVLKLKDRIKKPILLAVSYPSVKGGAKGCVQIGNQCKAGDALQLETVPGNLVADTQEQAVIYDAILSAVNTRPWIDGIISRGYYAPVVLQDVSSSIYGKPASDVLWYWFPRMLGTVK